MIQERTKGAMQAARRSQRSVGKVSQAEALSSAPIPADSMIELGLSLVENQGRNNDAASTQRGEHSPELAGGQLRRLEIRLPGA